MPNGGTDTCGSCWFNRRNKREFGYNHVDDPEPNYCEIRDVAIDHPFSTYCFNHPDWFPERNNIPVGPIFKGVYTGREIWKNSPDTEAIRHHLLKLLSDIPEQPTQHRSKKKNLDKIVVWQLGEFQERRAQEYLERLQGFTRQDLQLKIFAREALRKMTTPSARSRWVQRYTPSQMLIVEKMLLLLCTQARFRLWENVWENDDEYHWKFLPEEKVSEIYGEKSFDRIEFLNTLENEFQVYTLQDFEARNPEYTLGEVVDYLLAHYQADHKEKQEEESRSG